MLTSTVIEQLLAPLDGASPSGPDLEYDPDYLALQTAAQGKPEQQFGDTVIPAVEPEWRAVLAGAIALLQRSKDLRIAVLLTQSAMHVQGAEGLHLGLELLGGLLERDWETLHPALDADDNNDPTMRLNALAALSDDATLVRDLYRMRLGMARVVGPITMRDVLVARNALASAGEGGLSAAAVQGGLQELLQDDAALAAHLRALAPLAARVAALAAQRSGQAEALDWSRLHAALKHLQQVAGSGAATDVSVEAHAPASSDSAAPPPVSRASAPGDIRTRDDAVAMLDRVIHYLRQAEPGNPAPLLIERAKQLIGVGFLEIMANLAPHALESIEMVTGKRPES